MAWRKLAVALSNSQGSAEEYVAAATKAYDHRDRLTEVERYHTTAYYYFTVDWDPEKIISAYRAILELKPDDPIAPNNLALILDLRRRWAEAEPIAQADIDRGGTGTIVAQLVVAQMAQGRPGRLVPQWRNTFSGIRRRCSLIACWLCISPRISSGTAPRSSCVR
jgi:hypothetical protein